ncbi:MAG TPA: hypothetical protein VNE41_10455 [Chitinophagaceae bacterium]|nr:hypothetical protein [Chitinophagaceae bacterium]
MKTVFRSGDTKTFSRMVRDADLATFDSGNIHRVYATFALARDAEWVCRLFVLEMVGPGEEAMGTFISIDHISPALEGTEVEFTATVKSIHGQEIICDFNARVGERIIARGIQVQKILKKERLEKILAGIA